jgi:4-hydroxy-3-methylbut-2-en-1-yl diphosphate synthase IspG/GcpE
VLVEARLDRSLEANLQIRTASVEVKVQRLASNGHGAQVRRIVRIARDGRDTALRVDVNRGSVRRSIKQALGNRLAILAKSLDHLLGT